MAGPFVSVSPRSYGPNKQFFQVWFGRLNTFQPAADTFTHTPHPPPSLALAGWTQGGVADVGVSGG